VLVPLLTRAQIRSGYWSTGRAVLWCGVNARWNMKAEAAAAVTAAGPVHRQSRRRSPEKATRTAGSRTMGATAS
jgi:hypothetical protein